VKELKEGGRDHWSRLHTATQSHTLHKRTTGWLGFCFSFKHFVGFFLFFIPV
jgi:hypothetical protein